MSNWKSSKETACYIRRRGYKTQLKLEDVVYYIIERSGSEGIGDTGIAEHLLFRYKDLPEDYTFDTYTRRCLHALRKEGLIIKGKGKNAHKHFVTEYEGKSSTSSSKVCDHFECINQHKPVPMPVPMTQFASIGTETEREFTESRRCDRIIPLIQKQIGVIASGIVFVGVGVSKSMVKVARFSSATVQKAGSQTKKFFRAACHSMFSSCRATTKKLLDWEDKIIEDLGPDHGDPK